MATISEKYVGDREIHVSPRGSKYILHEDGRKLYVIPHDKPRRNFKARRGAFARFLDSQNSV